MSLRFTSFKPGIHKNSDLMQDTFSKLLANQLWDQNRTETVKHGTFCSACHTTVTALNHGTGDFMFTRWDLAHPLYIKVRNYLIASDNVYTSKKNSPFFKHHWTKLI